MRTSDRFPLRVPVRYRVGGEELASASENFSLGGLFLRTPRPFLPGTPVELEIAIPGESCGPDAADGSSIRLVGQVAWMVREHPTRTGGAYGMGVEIAQPNPMAESLSGLSGRIAAELGLP